MYTETVRRVAETLCEMGKRNEYDETFHWMSVRVKRCSTPTDCTDTVYNQISRNEVSSRGAGMTQW